MKKIALSILFLFIICTQAFSGGAISGVGGISIIPAPPSVDTRGDYDWTGDNEFSGSIHGTALYDYIGAGNVTIENYFEHSNSFVDNPTYWDIDPEYTVTPDENGFERFIRDGLKSTSLLMILQDGSGNRWPKAISNTGGKKWVLMAKVRPYDTEFPYLQLKIEDDSASYDQLNHLPAGWTNTRVVMDGEVSDGNIKPYFNTLDTKAWLGLDLEYMAVHEELPLGMISFGDSNTDQCRISSGIFSIAHSFINLYGSNNNIDIQNYGEGGLDLGEVYASMVAELGVGERYPTIFIIGGTNDIIVAKGGGSPVVTMLTDIELCINKAKLHTDNIVVITPPPSPAWELDGGEQKEWNDLYSDIVVATFGTNDVKVKVSDSRTYIDASDFDPTETPNPNVHMLITGHLKMYNDIELIQPLPYGASTYETPVTTGIALIDPNTSKKTERTNIDEYETINLVNGDTPFTLGVNHRRVFCDTTDGIIALTLEEGSEISKHHIFNTGANNVTIVPHTGEKIGGVVDDTITLTPALEDVIYNFDVSNSDWR